MKQAFKLMVFFASVFCTLYISADCCRTKADAVFSPTEKMYIHPEQLSVSEQGIFVLINQEWFQTNSLLSDVQGLYVQTLWPQENGCRKGYQPCRNCDKCIKDYYDTCPLCHRPA